MADCRIQNITKKDRYSQHEHITHVGVLGSWKWTREQVIESINNGSNTFFVLDPRTKNRSEVGVVYPGDGRLPFLRTHADGYYNDNLLSLPDF